MYWLKFGFNLQHQKEWLENKSYVRICESIFCVVNGSLGYGGDDDDG